MKRPVALLCVMLAVVSPVTDPEIAGAAIPPAGPIDAGATAPAVQEETYTAPDGTPVLVTRPEGSADRPPLLLFLHGGDRSNTRHHPTRYAREAGIDFPFLVLAPHCTGSCSWQRVDFDALLRDAVERYGVDRDRVYLTGYSMGAGGAWSLLAKSPQWFAAAAPIAGSGNPAEACAAAEAGVAIRAYHGDQDRVIPMIGSQRMIEALQACSGEAELIVYEGMDHGTWPRTFSDPDFWAWMLGNARESATP